MPDWVRPMARSGHGTVWQRHPETFCRKELHVSPMTSVIKSVRSPSAADHLGGPPNVYAPLLACWWSLHFVQVSTSPPWSSGINSFCPTLGFLNPCTTDILNQIILCWEGLSCRTLTSIPGPYMPNTISNIHTHTYSAVMTQISRRCLRREGDKIASSGEPLL